MIQIATALPAISAGPARPVLLAAQSGASNFALALSSLLVPGGAVAREPGEASVAGLPAAERQAVAEPGKELPEVALDTGANEEAPEQSSDADDEEAPAGEDLTFAWFATPAAPVAPPMIAPKAAAIDKPRAAIELPEASRTGEIAPARPGPVIAPPAEGEAAPTQAAQPVVSGERNAKAVPPAARVDAEPVADAGPRDPRVAPLPQRRAERPIAIVTRPVPPADAVETPAAPVAMAAVSGARAPASTEAPASAQSRAAPAAAPAPTPASAPPPAVASVPPPATATPAPVAAVTASPIPAPDGAAQPPAPVAAAQMPAPEAAAPAPAADAAAPAAIERSAPRAHAPAPVVQSARQSAPEPAQLLMATPLPIQAAAQGASAQPIAFAPLHRAFQEAEQPAVTSIAAPAAAILQQVAAAPDAQQGTLDMRRQEWLGKMVETIEAMREAAPVKETRLSLVPDALGKIDISVRQEGDRVHVHIAAETQAARQILTDAQPRLTELAEQRGIRLGQTSVDMGQAGANAQSGQRHNEAQRPQTPSAPASARAAKEQLTQSDDRVA